MKIKTFGFDPGTARDIGELFLPETSKTLTNGTCPGWHNAILISQDLGEKDENNNGNDEHLSGGDGQWHTPFSACE